MRRLRGNSRQRLALIAMAGVIALAAAACKPALTGNTNGPIGFESTDSPAYSTGQIDGQNGWVSQGAAGNGCAVYDTAVSTAGASGTQPTAYSGFGSQSLRMSDAVTSGCYSDGTFSAPTTDEAGETTAENGGLHSGGTRRGFFQASWSFADAGNPFAVQPGLHVVASPDRGDGARMSWIEMEDCSTTIPVGVHECQSGNAGFEVNFYEYDKNAPGDPDDPHFVFHNIANGLSRLQAHTISLRMWFFEGPDNDVVQVCVDSTSCVVGNSWEDYFRDEEGNPTRTVDSILFRTGGDADPGNAGNGFFIDNFSERAGNYTGAAFSVAGPPPIQEGNSGATNDPFTVTLSEPLPFTTQVHYATANGTATAPSDYTAQSGTLTFAPFQTTDTVNVPVNGDTTDEQNNETFTLNLSSPTSIGGTPTSDPPTAGAESYPSYAAIDTASATAKILDDDSTIRINDVSQNEGNSGTAPMPFTVTLDNASSVPVTVHYQTVNGSATAPSDYSAMSGTLTFNPGSTSHTVNVSIKGDTTPEGNENFIVNLTSPTNATIADANGVGTIINDD